MKKTMTRSVKGRVRYYTFEIISNLFGEWMVIRTYGSFKRTMPAGQLSESYQSYTESLRSYNAWIDAKRKRGYVSIKEEGENQ